MTIVNIPNVPRINGVKLPRRINLKTQDSQPESQVTLGVLTLLYDIGRSVSYGGRIEADMKRRYANPLMGVLDVGRAVYDSIIMHKGEWTDDMIDYRSASVFKDGSVFVRWITNPRSEGSVPSRTYNVILPPEGIIVPAEQGWYNRVGAPFAIVPFNERDKALRILEEYGIDPLKDPPCHFYPGEVDMIAAVRKGRGTNEGGKFNILAFEPQGKPVEHVGYRKVQW